MGGVIMAADQHIGVQVMTRWWEQDGLDLYQHKKRRMSRSKGKKTQREGRGREGGNRIVGGNWYGNWDIKYK